jgi:hypothetical protein
MVMAMVIVVHRMCAVSVTSAAASLSMFVLVPTWERKRRSPEVSSLAERQEAEAPIVAGRYPAHHLVVPAVVITSKTRTKEKKETREKEKDSSEKSYCRLCCIFY